MQLPHFIMQTMTHDVLGIRFENWKTVFMEQRSPGTMGKEFPPRQEPVTFTIDHAINKLHKLLAL
jgi:hypothetical protein